MNKPRSILLSKFLFCGILAFISVEADEVKVRDKVYYAQPSIEVSTPVVGVGVGVNPSSTNYVYPQGYVYPNNYGTYPAYVETAPGRVYGNYGNWPRAEGWHAEAEGWHGGAAGWHGGGGRVYRGNEWHGGAGGWHGGVEGAHRGSEWHGGEAGRHGGEGHWNRGGAERHGGGARVHGGGHR